MEDALNNWTFRLEEIVRQKVEKVKDLTTQAKESLKYEEEDIKNMPQLVVEKNQTNNIL